MAEHGKVAVIKVQNAGGVLTDVSTYFNTESLSEEFEQADVTTFGNDWKRYIPGLGDATISVEGPFEVAGHVLLAAIRNTERSWEFYPAGEGSGKPFASGQGILQSYETSAEVGDAGSMSGEFQVTGGVVWDVVA
jgi:hypothetical protein